MSNNLKSKIGSLIASVVEKSVIGYFSSLKRNTVSLLESVPDNTLKAYYGYILLLFLVVLAVSGVLLMTLGCIVLAVMLVDASFNRILLSGIMLLLAGLFYLLLGVFLLKGIGSLVHSSVSKTTGNLVKKIER
jgi:hypothetical protein